MCIFVLNNTPPYLIVRQHTEWWERWQYVQMIGFDSPVVKKIELNTKKHAKHELIKFAEHRIKTVDAIPQSKR